MATVSKTFNGVSGFATYTMSVTGTNITVSGSTFSIPHPTAISAKHVSGGTYAQFLIGNGGGYVAINTTTINSSSQLQSGPWTRDYGKATSGTMYSLTRTGSQSKSINTSSIFTSSNSTTRTVPINYLIPA